MDIETTLKQSKKKQVDFIPQTLHQKRFERIKDLDFLNERVKLLGDPVGEFCFILNWGISF